ncbi:proteasome subunit beta, partial [Candidatus Bathyarchaeota archaeon]|nr:proteasome subunit beta [Candidatus Bathyarchaeota archaeon]
SLIPDKYATVGSGAQIAVGVLEESYRDGLTLEEGRDLALRAMRSAIKRDIASGNGIDLLLISKDGIREENLTL